MPHRSDRSTGTRAESDVGPLADRGGKFLPVAVALQVARNTSMPVVTVDMYEGRTTDQKQRLVESITDAMVDHADASPEHLHVIINDVPKESWGRNGTLGIHRED